MTHILLATFISKDLLVTLFIGLLAGLLAQALTSGRGFGVLVSIFLGIVGGWLGNMLFKGFLNFNVDIPYFNEVIRSTAGAIILVLIINLIVGKNKKDKTAWKS